MSTSGLVLPTPMRFDFFSKEQCVLIRSRIKWKYNPNFLPFGSFKDLTGKKTQKRGTKIGTLILIASV